MADMRHLALASAEIQRTEKLLTLHRCFYPTAMSLVIIQSNIDSW